MFGEGEPRGMPFTINGDAMSTDSRALPVTYPRGDEQQPVHDTSFTPVFMSPVLSPNSRAVLVTYPTDDVQQPVHDTSVASVYSNPELSPDSGAALVTYPMEGVQQPAHDTSVTSVFSNSKKLEDDLQQMGEKIKHHEDNVSYLKFLRNKLEATIVELQAAVGKHQAISYKEDINGNAESVDCEEETIQNIMKHEKSAAALVCKMKSEAQFSNHLLIRDVVGIVATLGKVDDPNLSRLLSEYLGLKTILAVVCKSDEGVKTLEMYTEDGEINKSFGIHEFAASVGRHVDERFDVICLENLRPYRGELVVDDPQRRLNLLKPRLINGETPQGFLGFAVNMINIDNSNLHCISKSGHTLRETLFYNLFSNLQVYKSREDMLNARACITTGAISLDGGLIRRPGIFSLGHHGRDIDVKFPRDSTKSVQPANHFELVNQLKETKWKKERTAEDMQREQELLDHARFSYEIKKKEFVRFLAEMSSYMSQVGRVSTPR